MTASTTMAAGRRWTSASWWMGTLLLLASVSIWHSRRTLQEYSALLGSSTKQETIEDSFATIIGESLDLTPTSTTVSTHPPLPGVVFVDDDTIQNNNNQSNDWITCGADWQEWQTAYDFAAHVASSDATLVWTVAGGPEYRRSLPMLLEEWLRVEPDIVVLVVALDGETAQLACQAGHASIGWTAPAQSYSRVADAKVQVAAHLARVGVSAAFRELDVFCRRPVVPLLLNQLRHPVAALTTRKNQRHATNSTDNNTLADLVVIGHGDVQTKINIGLFWVRASPEAAFFFDSMVQLLKESLVESEIIRDNGSRHGWFDQDLFQACLRYPHVGDKAWFLERDWDQDRRTADTHNNILLACQNNLTSTMVSNIYISSYQPTLVMDQTICIHPLANTPFSSFAHKLATAKVLGYDPLPHPPDERILKVLSGDLTYNEDWDMVFKKENFHTESHLHKRFQAQMATLVHMARLSNRTLVLPRHLRALDGWTYPILSPVDIVSVEALVPAWRYMTMRESQALSDKPCAVDFDSDAYSHWDNITGQLLDTCRDQAVVAIHGLAHIHRPPPRQKKLVDQLSFCLQRPPHFRSTQFPFAEAIGSYAPLCNQDRADPPRLAIISDPVNKNVRVCIHVQGLAQNNHSTIVAAPPRNLAS